MPHAYERSGITDAADCDLVLASHRPKDPCDRWTLSVMTQAYHLAPAHSLTRIGSIILASKRCDQYPLKAMHGIWTSCFLYL